MSTYTYIFDTDLGCVGISAVSEAAARTRAKELGFALEALADTVEDNDPLYDDILDTYGCDVF